MQLDKLQSALETVNAIAPKRMQVHHVSFLLAVAELGQPTYKQLEERLDTSNASVSRCVHALGNEPCVGNKMALGLLENLPDPAEGRRHIVRLTAGGHRLVDALREV